MKESLVTSPRYLGFVCDCLWRTSSGSNEVAGVGSWFRRPIRSSKTSTSGPCRRPRNGSGPQDRSSGQLRWPTLQRGLRPFLGPIVSVLEGGSCRVWAAPLLAGPRLRRRGTCYRGGVHPPARGGSPVDVQAGRSPVPRVGQPRPTGSSQLAEGGVHHFARPNGTGTPS